MVDQSKKHQKRNRSKSSAGEESHKDTEEAVNRAQRIINSAVNVLEEEIAAGILAAKRIEKKLIDVEDIRSDPNALMNRIRRDSHEVLDLVIDAFAAVTSQMNTVVDALKDERKKGRKKKTKKTRKESEVMVVSPEHALKPGETTTLTLSICSDDSEANKDIALRKTDFLGPGNQKIHLRALSVIPPKLTLKPGEEKEIALQVRIPINSKPGRYNAFLVDENDPTIQVIVSIEVT